MITRTLSRRLKNLERRFGTDTESFGIVVRLVGTKGEPDEIITFRAGSDSREGAPGNAVPNAQMSAGVLR